MKKIIVLFTFLFALIFSGFLSASASETPSVVSALRWTARNDGDPPFVRIAMDLSKAVKAEAAIDAEGKNFQVILRNTKKENVASQYDMDSRIIDFATLSEKDGDTYLDILMTKPVRMADIRIFALRKDMAAGKPHRLVVDIPIPGAKKTYFKGTLKKPAVTKAPESKTSASPKFTVSEEAKQVLKGKVICIDPGHGGTDPGAIGHLNGKEVYEKNITLSIALPLRDLLSAAGAKVIMTRSTDKDVFGPHADDVAELQARCDIANEAHANAFLSIHIDAISNPAIDGVTAYYYIGSDQSLLLAHLLHRAAMKDLDFPNRGVRGNEFYVTAHTTMPSVLMELGYITNEKRVKMLTSKEAPLQIARSLFNGLADYFAQAG